MYYNIFLKKEGCLSFNDIRLSYFYRSFASRRISRRDWKKKYFRQVFVRGKEQYRYKRNPKLASYRKSLNTRYDRPDEEVYWNKGKPHRFAYKPLFSEGSGDFVSFEQALWDMNYRWLFDRKVSCFDASPLGSPDFYPIVKNWGWKNIEKFYKLLASKRKNSFFQLLLSKSKSFRKGLRTDRSKFLQLKNEWSKLSRSPVFASKLFPSASGKVASNLLVNDFKHRLMRYRELELYFKPFPRRFLRFEMNFGKFILLSKYLNFVKSSLLSNINRFDTGYDFFFNFFVVKHPTAFLVGMSIRRELEQKKYLFSFINQLVNNLVNKIYKIVGFDGFKISLTGRWARGSRSKFFVRRVRGVPVSNVKSFIDFFYTPVVLKYGVCSVKIWLFFKNLDDSFRSQRLRLFN